MNKKLISLGVSMLFLIGLVMTPTEAMDPPDETGSKPDTTSSSSAFTITPWKVEGAVDYDEVLSQFGVEPLTPELIARWEK